MPAEVKSVLDKVAAPKNIKADAWDLFYSEQTPESFKAGLDKLPLARETKAQLWDLRFSGGAAQAAPAAQPMNAMDRFNAFNRGAQDVAVGAAKGLGQFALGVGNTVLRNSTLDAPTRAMRALGIQGGPPTLDEMVGGNVGLADPDTMPELQAQGGPQRVGAMIGKSLPFMASSGAAGAGALRQAAAGALTSAAEEGELSPEQALAGVLGGAASGLGALGARSSAAIVNRYLKPALKLFNFGKNPGQGVVDEGIIAFTPEALAGKGRAALDKIGQTLTSMYLLPKNAAQKIDIRGAAKLIDDKIREVAAHSGLTGKNAIIDSLKELKANLVSVPGQAGANVTSVAPIRASRITTELGDAINWNQADDAAVKVLNETRRDLYGYFREQLNSKIKGAAHLNERYANLHSAVRAAESLAAKAQTHGPLSLLEMGTGIPGAATALMGVPGGIPMLLTAGALRGMRSAPGATLGGYLAKRMALMRAGMAPGAAASGADPAISEGR